MTTFLASGKPVSPRLLAARQQFIGGLAQRVIDMQQAQLTSDWPELVALAHRLKGTAGSYGLPELADLAETLEESVINLSPSDVICEQLQALAFHIAKMT